MKKVFLRLLLLTVFISPIASFTGYAQDLTATRNCFTWSLTLTNTSATAFGSLLLHISATVTDWSSQRINLAPGATQDFVFDGEILGEMTFRYMDALGTGGLASSNETFSIENCGESIIPVYCFVLAATYTNSSSTPGQSLTPGIYSSVTSWMGTTIILQPGETRDITFEGRFFGHFILLYYDARGTHGLDIANQTLNYELCDMPLKPLNTDNAAAPAALYLFSESANLLHVYAIDPVTSSGNFAFSATSIEIAQVSARAVETGENLLIAENMNVSLYALSSGECQVNGYFPDGKLYEYIFECPTPPTFLD
jgi:hypothetical protein